MVAHPSQLHAVPDDMTDEAAVMVEPTACAVHAALRASDPEGDTVVVLGAGTLGLLTHRRAPPPHAGAGAIIAAAKHPEQRAWPRELGADHGRRARRAAPRRAPPHRLAWPTATS